MIRRMGIGQLLSAHARCSRLIPDWSRARLEETVDLHDTGHDDGDDGSHHEVGPEDGHGGDSDLLSHTTEKSERVRARWKEGATEGDRA